MIKQWLILGYSHESFWQQTPKTFKMTFDANADRMNIAHNDRAWLAWHIAALGRTKKFPDLSKLQAKKANGISPPMEKQLHNLQRWVAATGGKVIVKPRDQ